MVETGLISFCERQARDGTQKTRRLAEASVAILKLAPKHPKIGSIKVEDIIQAGIPQ